MDEWENELMEIEMDTDIIHMLHILRDKFPKTYSAIAEVMDVNEDSLDETLLEAGVPAENYNETE